MTIAVIGILYGAMLAFAQTDLKRLVAYTSISHMGFVLLGVFALNEIAMQGAVIQILCHGISTGALFVLVGALDERIHTRNLDQMGGLWAVVPRMGGVTMLFALASLGLPGLGNFIGEFLVLFGSYRVNIPLTVLATVGIVFATIYSLWIIQRAFHGPMREFPKLRDLTPREVGIMALLIAAIVWLGFAPQPVFNLARPSVESVIQNLSEQRETNRTVVGTLGSSGREVLLDRNRSDRFIPFDRSRRRNDRYHAHRCLETKPHTHSRSDSVR